MEGLTNTNDFKFLDKASILTSKKGKLSPCSVTQVEETKIIFRLVPIALSSIICYVPVTLLLTLTVQQGNTMNKKVGRIHISPASLFFIPITFQMLILFLYDRFIMPFGRRLIKDGSGITSLKRVGLGYFTTTISMCLAAMIEKKRKQVAIEHGMVEATTGIPMSVLWLGFQFFVLGIFDATSFVGLLEFFNSEVSKGMKSLGTAIFWCILGLGSLLGSFLVHLVNQFTRHSQGEGWLGGNNLNKNHLDRFYWLLALIGFISFINYLWWALQYSSRQFYTRV
ncbi:protein NRT1/ PTR FAMILY 4.6-like [Amborella trichopoda]|uniref:protein NRT1/ PTR FAMILY 4.6-like n=1 Tax=Amborella trichopoda TaxID=13333 RepID=UPI0009BEA1D4|nr:protein NRT1/ PTR FAMILY 4.6-like [Amborella trichopoda]|eukprot:XP_020520386.1 protein NRT1/ PTR FAMILY 4.6-like [Amborella trichopoda]